MHGYCAAQLESRSTPCSAKPINPTDWWSLGSTHPTHGSVTRGLEELHLSTLACDRAMAVRGLACPHQAGCPLRSNGDRTQPAPTRPCSSASYVRSAGFRGHGTDPLAARRSVSSAQALPSTSTPAASTATPRTPPVTGEARSHETDVIIIGSGIGGLSAGAMLAKYGFKVWVGVPLAPPGLATKRVAHAGGYG